MHDWIHTPDDGRGRREVFLNGRKVLHAVYADTKKGKVRRSLMRADKYGKRVLLRTEYGKVDVRPL